MQTRETFASRLGFILIAAGCAVGLGNMWRFPYITGLYGGATFVFIYLLFLLVLGLPILIMEFSVGRASKLNIGASFKALEPKGTYWHKFGTIGIVANYLLMMFYTPVCGWMLAYFYYSLTGKLSGLSPEKVGEFFGELLSKPIELIFWTFLSIIIGAAVCKLGVRNGIEKITKVMMGSMFIIMIVLAIRSITLEGASAGLSFYLLPDFSKIQEHGLGEIIFAAMGQAFFTLSVGIGSMAIFGSYLNDKQSLTSEGLAILGIDTIVALLAGCIIFPACFAFNINPGQGPGLIFVTLPNVFNEMFLGMFWAVLFFAVMSLAALSTVIAVFENILSYGIDVKGWTREKSTYINMFALFILSLPCIFGFNIWSDFAPLGEGTVILDLEDFIVSNNFLPIGSLIYLLFCVSKYGWGWDNFIKEANTGDGMKFPEKTRFYLVYILPIIIIFIFIKGYTDKFL